MFSNSGFLKTVFISFAAAFLVWGCSSSEPKNQAGGETAGGMSWTAPGSWSIGPEKQMRARTYIIKAADGDNEDAECAVFYFGQGQGGDKESNIERWTGQFEQADGRPSGDVAVVNEMESNGLKITTIGLDGIYLMSGPMMQVNERKLGWRLMGAIVEGPHGLVFFKMVGPEKTVLAAQDEFNKMISSIKAETT